MTAATRGAQSADRDAAGARSSSRSRTPGCAAAAAPAFPPASKWGFLPKDSPKPTLPCVNADESEPGTFKDRQIIELNPHLLLEGHDHRRLRNSLSYGLHLHPRRVRARREGPRGGDRARLCQGGYLGKNVFGTGYDLDVYVHRGAGAYICGEETGLIESLEGKRAYPRVKPPFPATYGVFGCPTIVNNVETLVCVVPPIVEPRRGLVQEPRAGEESRAEALSASAATSSARAFTRARWGPPLRDVDLRPASGGGVGGKKLKAVIPGGSSVPVFTSRGDRRGDGLRFGGQGGLAAGILRRSWSWTRTLAWCGALRVIARFYHHESCGQCTPCREGTGWLEKVLMTHLEDGGVEPKDVDLLMNDLPTT